MLHLAKENTKSILLRKCKNFPCRHTGCKRSSVALEPSPGESEMTGSTCILRLVFGNLLPMGEDAGDGLLTSRIPLLGSVAAWPAWPSWPATRRSYGLGDPMSLLAFFGLVFLQVEVSQRWSLVAQFCASFGGCLLWDPKTSSWVPVSVITQELCPGDHWDLRKSLSATGRYRSKSVSNFSFWQRKHFTMGKKRPTQGMALL